MAGVSRNELERSHNVGYRPTYSQSKLYTLALQTKTFVDFTFLLILPLVLYFYGWIQNIAFFISIQIKKISDLSIPLIHKYQS